MNQNKSNNGYFWNTIAGFVNAGESVLLSAVVTRTRGIEDAGILTIAFAIGNLMMAIGKFGVRTYQSTDVNEEHSFSDYFWTRILTVGLMIMVSIIYIAYCVQKKGYSSQKACVIFAVCVIYAAEAVEDVFWGLYQQKKELDQGAKIFILRWVVILGTYLLLLLEGKELQAASIAGAVNGIAACFLINFLVFRTFGAEIGRPDLASVKQILQQCFPLAAVSFLSFYVTNAPKYAIDRYLTEEVQACYGFIAMPVFVISMLNSFIYQPSLVNMAVEWEQGRMQEFRKRVRMQCMVLLCLMACCLGGAYLCGIPVLSFLFAVELHTYKRQLLILIFGGGMLAFAGYFSVILTIMRRQSMIMIGYMIVAALALLLTNQIVKIYQVTGASVLYTMLMALLAACFYFMYKVYR